MPAVTYDLEIEQGAAYVRQFAQYAPDGVTPANIDPPAARMQIRSGPGEAVLVSVSTTSGGIVVSGNTLTLTLGATLTAKIPADAQYDLELFDPSNPDNVTRWLQGQVLVDPQITNP